MKKIILFHKEEKRLLDQFLDILKREKRNSDRDSIEHSRNALKDLAEAISMYPPIMGKQQLGNISRSVETLIDMLCMKEDPDLILHIPTKALVGKGFLIAKINFFYMFLYLAKGIGDSREIQDVLHELKMIISNNIFTLMSEEVFLSIIEDRKNSMHIRTNAGYLLANIWEYRLDHGIREFAPILSNIWKAREQLKPAFGTLMGFTELFKLSQGLDPLWLEFIDQALSTEEETSSLEEFLFGLSFEEISRLRGFMELTERNCLSPEDIFQVIGESSAYPRYDPDDSREFYRSFRHRLINTKVRKRARLMGPKKTIEEYIICYLLSRPSEKGGLSPVHNTSLSDH